MNEQLQAALAEMLGKANAGIDAGTSFLQAQMPDVVQQLLVWKATVSFIWFALALIVMVGLAVGMTKYCWLSESMDTDDKAFIALICTVPSVALAVVITENIDWLQIWIAPKIYLIEYAASLAK